MALVRTTRARVIHLRNDYKLVMSRLEQAVHAQFAAQPSTRVQQAVASTPSGISGQEDDTRSDTPFAKVNSVVANSPAAEAGLQPGDKVTRFGSATWLNHDKLAKVAQIVSQSEGVSCETSLDSTVLTLHFAEANFCVRSERFSGFAFITHTKVKLGWKRDARVPPCGLLTCQRHQAAKNVGHQPSTSTLPNNFNYTQGWFRTCRYRRNS
jgi:hypothetical protein